MHLTRCTLFFRLLTSDSKVVRLGVRYIVYTAVAEIFSSVIFKFQEVYGKGKVWVHLITVMVRMGRTYGAVSVVGAVENQTRVNVRTVDSVFPLNIRSIRRNIEGAFQLDTFVDKSYHWRRIILAKRHHSHYNNHSNSTLKQWNIISLNNFNDKQCITVRKGQANSNQAQSKLDLILKGNSLGSVSAHKDQQLINQETGSEWRLNWHQNNPLL